MRSKYGTMILEDMEGRADLVEPWERHSERWLYKGCVVLISGYHIDLRTIQLAV